MLDFDDAVTSLLDVADREDDAMTSSWDRARAVADAVLYEGYLLYPYRGDVEQEPVTLAVRRAGTAGRGRRRHRRGRHAVPRSSWSTAPGR